MKYQPKPFQRLVGEAPIAEEYYNNRGVAGVVGEESNWYYDGTDEDALEKTPEESSEFQFVKAKEFGTANWLLVGAILVGMVLTVIFGLKESMLCLVCVGFVFVIAGCIGICSRKGKPDVFLLLIFPVIGISLVILGLVLTFSSKETIENMMGSILFIASLIVLLCGFLALCAYIMSCVYRKRVFTEEITAPCVALIYQISSSDGDNSITYCPVYTILYRDRVFNLQEDVFSNIGVPNVGDQVKLMINPNDPYDFCRKKGIQKHIFLIIALILIFIAAVTFWAAIMQ